MTTGGSTPSGTIADPRAYMQQRVALYAKATFWFFGGLSAMFIPLMIALPPPGSLAAKVGMMVIMVAVSGAVWWYVRTVERSETTLRLIEVLLTLFACFYVGTGPLSDPDPASAAIGIIHVSALIGSVLILRAAVVPSPVLTSVAVGIASYGPVLYVTSTAWTMSPPAMESLPQPLVGPITFGLTGVSRKKSAKAAWVRCIAPGTPCCSARPP